MTKQFLVLIFGHNASGKTVLSRKLLQDFHINRVNGDDIRDFLISNIDYYSDAHYSYPNSKIISANKFISAFRTSLVKELLSQGESVLVDGAGIEKKARKKYLDLTKVASGKITTVIIECGLEEEQILDRLEERNRLNSNHKWVDFYNDIRKEKFEKAAKDEADVVLYFNQGNYDEVLKSLKTAFNQ